MKKSSLILFLFISFSGLSQKIDTNENIFHNSSEYRNYQEVYLGNLGLAKYNLINPFETNNKRLKSLFPSTSNTNTFTDVFYVFGSGRENYVDVVHRQQLSENLFGSAKILKTNSEGIYLNQNATLSDFAFNLDYNPKDKRYGFLAQFENYKRRNNINGGVADSNFFALLDSGNANIKTTFPTQFIEAAQSASNYLDLKVMDVNFRHNYKISKTITDSTPYFQLTQKLSYHRTQQKIGLRNSTSYFEDYNYDTITTLDSLKLERLSHRFQLDRVSKNMTLSVGIAQNYYEYLGRNPFEIHLENLLFTEVKWRDKGFFGRSYFEFMVSDGKYESYEFKNNITYRNRSLNIFQRFSANANFMTDLPELYANNYRGNHFEWNKVNNRNTIIQLNVSALNEFNGTKVELNFESQSGAVIFDTNSLPIQTNISLLGFTINKRIQFKKWMYLTTNIHIQDLISKSEIEVPNLVTYTKLHFKGRLIKKVLKFDAGLSVLYYTNFTPRAYNSSLDEFYLQSNQRVGNYPIVGFFAEFYIKKNFSFFSTITHLNSGLLKPVFGNNYLATTEYPLQDRAFKFGIKWRLFD
ncbi:MAG: putative porin [Flavobacteriales bacterium]